MALQKTEHKENYPVLKTLLNVGLTSIGVGAHALICGLDMVHHFTDTSSAKLYSQIAGATGSALGGAICSKIQNTNSLAPYRIFYTTILIMSANAFLVPLIIEDVYKEKLNVPGQIYNFTIEHYPSDQISEWNAALTMLTNSATYLAADILVAGMNYPVNYYTSLPQRTQNFVKGAWNFFKSRCGTKEEMLPLIIQTDDEEPVLKA